MSSVPENRGSEEDEHEARVPSTCDRGGTMAKWLNGFKTEQTVSS